MHDLGVPNRLGLRSGFGGGASLFSQKCLGGPTLFFQKCSREPTLFFQKCFSCYSMQGELFRNRFVLISIVFGSLVAPRWWWAPGHCPNAHRVSPPLYRPAMPIRQTKGPSSIYNPPAPRVTGTVNNTLFIIFN